jgi:hypothetical protein
MPSIIRSNDPTVWDDIDGIYIDETAPPPSVVGAAVNVGILVGQSERGLTDLTTLGGTQDFFERFGKNNTFGINKALLNKRFGTLKLIRVVASDAVQASKAFQSSATDRVTFKAKQGKGAFGNSIQVKIEEASSSRQEKHTVGTVADVADSLDGKYFVLRDEVGTVGVWIDVDDDGAAAPAGATACARQIEITTIATGDSAATVATKIAAVLEADSKFSASADGTTITVTCVAYAPGVGTIGNGDSGFTVARTQLGVKAGRKYTIRDNNATAVLPVETYDDVLLANVATDLTFAGSKLIEATVNSSAAEPDYCDFTSLASGADGTVADADYETAIAKAAVEKAGNVLFLDSYNSARNGYLKTHAADTGDKMVILCGPEVQTVDEVITDVAAYRDTDGRIIYAYPYVETSIDGVLTFTPPASWYASILTQTAPQVSPSFVDNARFMAGATSLKYNLTVAQHKQLNAAGVSAFERDEDFGFLVKNAVVTQIANSSKLTVIRRRMTDYLTASAALFLKNYSNAVNSSENRMFVKGALLDFVLKNEREKILPKDSEVQDGKAKIIDVESLNSNSSIAQGMFRIKWRQRIYSSMRYIVLSVEVGEGVVVNEEEG